MKKNFNFWLLTLGNFVSRMGSQIYLIALSWWIINEFQSNIEWSYIIAASSLGNVIFSPFAGVLVDGMKKKYVLILTDFVSGFVCLYMALLVLGECKDIIFYILGSFALGVCSAAFKPAVKAIMPCIVEKDYLVKANSINNNLGEVSKLLGPGVAVWLLSISQSAAVIILIDGISFIISAISEIFIRYKEQEREYNKNFKVQLVEGFKYLRTDKLIFTSVAVISMVNVFLASFDVLMPAYVSIYLEKSEVVYSNYMTVYALGALAITFIVMILKEIKVTEVRIMLSLLITGIGFLLLGISDNVIFSGIVIGLLGAVVAYFNTIFFSFIQIKVDSRYIGRVFSIIFTFAMVFTPISSVIFGVLGDFTIAGSFILSGIGVVVLSLIYILLSREKTNNDIIDE